MVTQEEYQKFRVEFYAKDSQYKNQRYGQAFLNRFSDRPEVDAHRVGPYLWEDKSVTSVEYKLIYVLKLVSEA